MSFIIALSIAVIVACFFISGMHLDIQDIFDDLFRT